MFLPPLGVRNAPVTGFWGGVDCCVAHLQGLGRRPVAGDGVGVFRCPDHGTHVHVLVMLLSLGHVPLEGPRKGSPSNYAVWPVSHCLRRRSLKAKPDRPLRCPQGMARQNTRPRVPTFMLGVGRGVLWSVCSGNAHPSPPGLCRPSLGGDPPSSCLRLHLSGLEL